jgi:hypothetical protein
MTQVAKDSGITREALYKALRPGSEPRFETVSRVCAALGVRLVAEPSPLHALSADIHQGLVDAKAKRVGALNVDAIKSQGRQRHKQATKE